MASLKWRNTIIFLLAAVALYSVAPTIVYFSTPKAVRNDAAELAKRMPSWLPQKHIKLGLDLQGGVQLVLGVDTTEAVDNKLGRMATELSRWAEDEGIGLEKAYAIKGEQRMRVVLQPDTDVGDFRVRFKEEFPSFEEADHDGVNLSFSYSDDEMKRIREAALGQAERVVRTRIDKWGVSEPQISRRAADKAIMVQLPGFRDPDKARELLGRTAQLRFQMVVEDFKGIDNLLGSLPEGVTANRFQGGQTTLVSENKEALQKLYEGKIKEGTELYFESKAIAGGAKKRYEAFVVFANAEISGEDVIDAMVTYNTESLSQDPAVSLRMTGPGGKRFADVTGKNTGKRMAIVLDDEVISAPRINGRIPGGNALITLGAEGTYQEQYDEANKLSLILRSGALPATITILEERQVGASLGPELANQGISSVAAGLGLVILFMLIYYRRPGFISCIALTLNGLFLLAVMAGFEFALTLPGFAGFILTLGMAVDANVLINERIRQELREGKNARKAVENGFQKVFWTIIDANVTTLIAAMVLLETNSAGPIKGFAVALIIGLLVSMFTALYCSKVLFFTVISRPGTTDGNIRAWLGGKAAEKSLDLKHDFLKSGKAVAAVGIAIALAVLGVGATKGFNWAVDFAGGTEIEVGFDQGVSTEDIRGALGTIGISNATLQTVGSTTSDQSYLIRFDKGDGDTEVKDRSADVRGAVSKELAKFNPVILRTDFVGPLIGKELTNQAALSVVWAIIGVLIYIAFRFDMRFGPGAITKMILDVILILGFYVFFQVPFDLTSIAALLTVVGYSVNDTIVIYDRIRENLQYNPRRPLYENINTSLNETLSRTINTSLTTIAALLGVLIFGTGQIWNFAAAMTIGVVVATISSTFVASSFILWLEQWRKHKAA